MRVCINTYIWNVIQFSVVEKASEGDWDRRNCCFSSGVELISLQLQGHPRSKEKAFQTSCCQCLPDFGSLERRGRASQISSVWTCPSVTTKSCLSQLAQGNSSFPDSTSHAFPTPSLLKIKQSIRALLSGSDISQVQINTPSGPWLCENQLILCASLPIAAPGEEEPQHLPAWAFQSGFPRCLTCPGRDGGEMMACHEVFRDKSNATETAGKTKSLHQHF